MNKLKFTFAIVVLFCSAVANAALVTVSGKIATAYSFSDYGAGDVVFQMTVSGVGCETGFWLRPTDPGFKSNLSFLLAAHLSGRNVSVQGYNDSIWTGSAGKYCRLYSISFQ